MNTAAFSDCGGGKLDGNVRADFQMAGHGSGRDETALTVRQQSEIESVAGLVNAPRVKDARLRCPKFQFLFQWGVGARHPGLWLRSTVPTLILIGMPGSKTAARTSLSSFATATAKARTAICAFLLMVVMVRQLTSPRHCL